MGGHGGLDARLDAAAFESNGRPCPDAFSIAVPVDAVTSAPTADATSTGCVPPD